MIHILNEGNKELKHRVFPLGKGIKKHLIATLKNYEGNKTVDGYKRLNNILSMDNGISYNEMKRIKNFFDNYQGTDKSVEFILNGGEPMKLWVNNTLNTATKSIHDFKQAKKDSGINNAFIKTHEKDRQVKTKNKPTQVKFKTNDINNNLSDNNLLKFENNLHTGASLNKKIIYITEQQEKLIKLNEAQDNTFSLQELSNIRSFKNRYNYCIQHLGKPQGRGSSRVVFQLDDEKVLKLAFNSKGIAQNEAEYDKYLEQLGIVPYTFDTDDNGLWNVTEYVLPAKKSDFVECVGMSFEDFVKFIKSCYAWREDYNKAKNGGYRNEIFTMEEYEELLENEDLSPFDDYIGNYRIPIGDLTRLCNYGLTMRNGYPTIVILDTGLTQEVYDSFYRRY